MPPFRRSSGAERGGAGARERGEPPDRGFVSFVGDPLAS
jgi:hypothetical protein